MNIILTGVSGTLGSQLLLELLKDKKIETVFLLIRDRGSITANERFERILESICFNTDTINGVKKKTKVLNADLFFKPEKYLSKKEDNYFIHSAGFVNLTTDALQKATIFENNFHFTEKIFETFNSFIKKFTYISTAFSIGAVGGLITNDYHGDVLPNYRNAYEASKHKTEQYLIEEANKKGVTIQILRPSVIGGNIENKPDSYISKFMVYYLIGKFFYKNPLLENNDMRLSINFKTGLNIVPVDYVCKVIMKVLFKDIQQLNIVHNKCTSLRAGFTRIIETVGYKRFSFLNNVPTDEIKDKNTLEEFYYASIGKHLSPYNLCEPYEFDTKTLEEILPMPKYNLEDYLEKTINYAITNNFRNEKW